MCAANAFPASETSATELFGQTRLDRIAAPGDTQQCCAQNPASADLEFHVGLSTPCFLICRPRLLVSNNLERRTWTCVCIGAGRFAESSAGSRKRLSQPCMGAAAGRIRLPCASHASSRTRSLEPRRHCVERPPWGMPSATLYSESCPDGAI